MEQEAGSLPAAVPETEGLTALLQKAEEWKAKAAALAAQKAPLKKMREVLHMGLRMPVEVPQVEALRAEIRRREWEDTAKKVRKCLKSQESKAGSESTFDCVVCFANASACLCRHLRPQE